MKNQARCFATLLAQFEEAWSPRVVGEVDGHMIKLVKLRGAFDWHAHQNEDEMFVVLEGMLRMELRNSIQLVPAGSFIIIEKGVEHRPVAESEECHVMLIERASVVNTGDGPQTLRTVLDLAQL
jgi:mannose-6-phosphate isomerase-like protein (cupin superfamily)